MGSYLTREQIIEAQDRDRETVATPEWGEPGQVLVQVMSGIARDQFDRFAMEMKQDDGTLDTTGMRVKLCQLCIVDEEGNQLFAEADIPILAQKNGDVLTRIFLVAQRLNKLTQEDLGEIEGN